MLTREQVLEAIKDGTWKSETITGRDLSRLAEFFPVADWVALGLRVKDGADVSAIVTREWSEEEVKKQLADDVAFGFEKALNQRGISAREMHSVVKMWMWALEDELQRHSGYAQYGLPLFKAVALKYSLPNEIGDDRGTEYKYSEHGEGC